MGYFNFYYAGQENHSFNTIIAADTLEDAQRRFDTWLSGSTERVNLQTTERWLERHSTIAYGDDVFGWCNVEELKEIGEVGDFSGVDFIRNPVLTGTHIFHCYSGIFICLTPGQDERFKYQPVFRAANEAEVEVMQTFLASREPATVIVGECQCGQGGCYYYADGHTNCGV